MKWWLPVSGFLWAAFPRPVMRGRCGYRPNGELLVIDGPYTEAKEHVIGFWVLKAADLNEALAWGRKAALACRALGRGASVLLFEVSNGAVDEYIFGTTRITLIGNNPDLDHQSREI